MSARDFVDEPAEAYRARLADLIDAYGTPQADPATLGETAALTSAATLVWTEHVGPFVEAEGAAQLLAGVTRQAVSQRVRARRLFGLRTGSGRTVFPLWEFDGRGVLEGRPAVLDAAGYDPDRPTTVWTIASWLCTHDPDLGGRPRELLAAGHADRVVALARKLRTELGVDERATSAAYTAT